MKTAKRTIGVVVGVGTVIFGFVFVFGWRGPIFAGYIVGNGFAVILYQFMDRLYKPLGRLLSSGLLIHRSVKTTFLVGYSLTILVSIIAVVAGIYTQPFLGYALLVFTTLTHLFFAVEMLKTLSANNQAQVEAREREKQEAQRMMAEAGIDMN